MRFERDIVLFVRFESAQQEGVGCSSNFSFFQPEPVPFNYSESEQWTLEVNVGSGSERRPPTLDGHSDWRCRAFLGVESTLQDQFLKLNHLKDQFHHAFVKPKDCLPSFFVFCGYQEEIYSCADVGSLVSATSIFGGAHPLLQKPLVQKLYKELRVVVDPVGGASPTWPPSGVLWLGK